VIQRNLVEFVQPVSLPINIEKCYQKMGFDAHHFVCIAAWVCRFLVSVMVQCDAWSAALTEMSMASFCDRQVWLWFMNHPQDQENTDQAF
jgi:hypothetical protein